MDPLYRTQEWRNLSNSVLKRDGYKCKRCGRGAIVAHHTTYQFGIICSPRFLVSLCDPCHNEIHAQWNYGKMVRAELDELRENGNWDEYYRVKNDYYGNE
jgi:ribosomal protein S27AE